MGTSPDTTRKTRQAVEKVFGPLTWSDREFVSVGVHHVHHTNGTVELDQDTYIKQLNPIAGPSPYGKLLMTRPTNIFNGIL